MECPCTTNTGFISGGLNGRDGYSVGGIGDRMDFCQEDRGFLDAKVEYHIPNPGHVGEVVKFAPPQAARAWPEHSCYKWNHQHYISTPDYTATQCGLCGRITDFKWRSRWRRFKTAVRWLF